MYDNRFGRSSLDRLDRFRLDQRFDVEGYLEYHGAKLVGRFDANSYLRLCKAMDLHDVGRGRNGIASALGRITVPTLTMSVSSDALYPPRLQHELRDALAAGGTPVEHISIDSPHGHDAFLIETDQVGPPTADFIAEVHKHHA